MIKNDFYFKITFPLLFSIWDLSDAKKSRYSCPLMTLNFSGYVFLKANAFKKYSSNFEQKSNFVSKS
jgi:hypothetical protein